MRNLDEAQRLAALDRYKILDTAPQEDFDDIAALAAMICDMPVALISFVDDKRQWFKARLGVDVTETPREIAFCAHAIQQHDTLVVNDASKDARFAANPLVTGDINLRFYAGAQLETPDGFPLGTLCVLDTKPREISAEQQRALEKLANQVIVQLELRRALAKQREDELRYQRILDSAIDTVIISTDLEGAVTSWNAGARTVIGYDEAEILGRPVDHFFTPEDRAAGLMRAEMSQALTKGHAEHDGWRVRKDGSRFWASGQMTPLRDEDGIVTGYVKVVRDRTADRNVRDALLSSREQLELAQTAGEIGTFALDVVADLLHVTPAFCRLYGLPPLETMSPDVFERCVLPEDRTIASALATRRSGEAPGDVEYRVQRADDGAVRWIHRKARFVHAPDGSVTQMVGVAQDVTDRKMAEATLKASETQFRTLAQAMLNQVWSAPAHGGLDWFNQRVLDYTGLSAEQLAGTGWTSAVHPDDLPQGAERWAESIASGSLYETEFRIRRSDGLYRWHIVRAVPYDNETDGRRWIGTNTDIDDQKAALALLTQSNATLQGQVAERTADRDRMWQLSTDVMLVADFQGLVTAVNPAWTRLFGWKVADLIGTNFMDLVHPEDVAMTIAEVAKLQQGLTTLRFENRFRTHDGGFRPLSWTAVPDTGFIHAVGRDITAEREAAAELEHAQEALRQAQKMEAVGQLTGGIAHDFNNLLTGIIGSLDMMQRKAAQGKAFDVDRYATAAMTSANRAAALTHRLLAFSRRQPLDPKPVNANRLVTGMEELLRRSIGEAVRLEMVTAGGLWQTKCDPNQLENAILNLAINGRDAMPTGGTLTIETCNAHLDTAYAARSREVRPGQYVCICVTDTGSGMAADVIAKAFDPFFTTKPIGQGTGLGLSMIYGFARQSEGYARIYSEVGKGTTVKIYLPRFYGEDEVGEGDVEAPRDEAAGHGEIVLVVEDESAVRALVVDVLEELGYRAIEADDGPSGLKLLQSDMRIDLLVTDVGLPGLNGRQLADFARDKRPDLKVLFMTGYAENAAIAGGFLDAGMEMITKPFAIEALAQRIRGMIDAAE